MVNVWDGTKHWVEFSSTAKAIVIGIMVVTLFAAAWIAEHPVVNVTVETKRGGANNEIIFPCPPGICEAHGIFIVHNSDLSHAVFVNATHSCNCNATVTFTYSPSVIERHENNTIMFIRQGLMPGNDMLIEGSAFRFSGNDSITVDIHTQVI